EKRGWISASQGSSDSIPREITRFFLRIQIPADGIAAARRRSAGAGLADAPGNVPVLLANGCLNIRFHGPPRNMRLHVCSSTLGEPCYICQGAYGQTTRHDGTRLPGARR